MLFNFFFKFSALFCAILSFLYPLDPESYDTCGSGTRRSPIMRIRIHTTDTELAQTRVHDWKNVHLEVEHARPLRVDVPHGGLLVQRVDLLPGGGD